RRLVSPRHVEVQVLADAHGAVVPFVERECSVQRRHQKVIEESPSPSVTPALRQALADAAEAIARTVGYVNAGTIEFLVDADGAFSFLEMNARLQGEHPVTEMVTGVDLVQWQLRLADGEPLTLTREQAMTPRGHAIECRVYAEDPDRGFLPCPGRITSLRVPSGPGVRDDSGVATGFTVPVHYDSLLSKLVAWGETRDSARRRMLRALDEYHVGGIETTLPFFRWMLQHEAFVRGAVDTTFLDAELAARADASFVEPDADTVRLAIAATAIDQWFAARDRDRSDAARGTLSGWARAARQDARRPGSRPPSPVFSSLPYCVRLPLRSPSVNCSGCAHPSGTPDRCAPSPSPASPPTGSASRWTTTSSRPTSAAWATATSASGWPTARRVACASKGDRP